MLTSDWSSCFELDLHKISLQQPFEVMAEPQLGLKLAFYAYPCLLFLTLLGGQSIQYYYNRRKGSESSISDAQKQKATTTRRNYEKTIWALQLILSLLFLASTVLAVLEAVSGQHAATGHIRFPFSAYLVCALVHVES